MATRFGVTVRELRDDLVDYCEADPAGGRDELLVKINGDLRRLRVDFLSKRLILRAGPPVK